MLRSENDPQLSTQLTNFQGSDVSQPFIIDGHAAYLRASFGDCYSGTPASLQLVKIRDLSDDAVVESLQELAVVHAIDMPAVNYTSTPDDEYLFWAVVQEDEAETPGEDVLNVYLTHIETGVTRSVLSMPFQQADVELKGGTTLYLLAVEQDVQ